MFKLRLLLFLLIISCQCYAATFVVTTNADSGPGSLRQALLDAAGNGALETDYINFNIADQSTAGRTITVQGSLPNVTSKLVIDGTTQTGGKFGKSDAKIIIQPANSTNTCNLFYLNQVDGFELYGLYLRDFVGVLPFDGSTAIRVTNSKNIQIGAPGKGNVFANNSYCISTIYGPSSGVVNPPYDGIENLTLYSNFFGTEPDGKTSRGQLRGLNPFVELAGCGGNMLIGGDNSDQRNIFCYSLEPIQSATVPSRARNTKFIIKNNYFHYDADGNYCPLPAINTSTAFIFFLRSGSTYDNSPVPYSIYILNNKIQAPGVIEISTVTGDIVVQGNVSKSENYPNKPAYTIGSLQLQSTGNILIGGEQPGEANIFENCELDLFSRKSVLIQHNSIYCTSTTRGIWWPAVPYPEAPLPLPVISINNITATKISGTATPLSKVELFWDDDCIFCQPLNYITTVSTDESGNWEYNGPVQKGVIASATLNGFTSLFTISATANSRKISHYSCIGKGSITGVSYTNTGGYQWKDANGNIIGTNPDIYNLMPGTYTLTAMNGSCSNTYTYKVADATPVIVDTYKHIVQPSCTGKGTINGLYLNNPDVISDANLAGEYNIYTYKWIDANNQTRSTSIDLNNVEAGTYTLLVTYKNTCGTTYGPITLTNTIGPNIDQSTAIITNTPCGQAKGSITNLNITGLTGTVHYSWKNDLAQEVATTKDLLNQPGGKYVLEITDGSSCGPVYSAQIEIPEINGIGIDETTVLQTNSTCQDNNGTIKNIKVTGATSIKWLNETNQLVGTSADLVNMGQGAYHLVATNGLCEKSSRTYSITRQLNTSNYGGSTKITKNATCGLNNGSIEVTLQNYTVLPKSYRWQNSSAQTVGGNSTLLSNIDAGAYSLYGSDENGCEKFIVTYSIGRTPEMKVQQDKLVVVNDQCGLGKGSIKGIVAVSGTAPYTYTWQDASGKVVGHDADLINVTAGNYTLHVHDAQQCADVITDVSISDESLVIAPPVAKPLQLCAPGDALLVVSPSGTAKSFRLYASAADMMSLDEQVSGRFRINIKNNRSYYVSQLNGTCESMRVEVPVTVGLSAVNIVNAISPNNDGINDYWILNGIESYPKAVVQVFSRSGQKVFESTGYNKPFDGNFNGNALPSGAYYYIINLSANCKLISGSLTIIR